MELIDELMGALNAHPELPLYERAVLKLAVSPLDQKKQRYSKHHHWRVRLTLEEIDALPGERVLGSPRRPTVSQVARGCRSDVPAIEAAESAFCGPVVLDPI